MKGIVRMANHEKSPETMKLDFEAVARHYGVPSARKRERQVLQAMVKHEYITPLKAAQQNTELVNVAHGTLTKAISTLRSRGVPITKTRPRDSSNTLYTRYHLDRVKVAADMAATPS